MENQPKNIEMERELISSLMIREGEIIPEVAAILTPADFYLPRHQRIFSVIVDLYNRRVVPTILTIAQDYKKKFNTDFEKSPDEYNAILELGAIACTNAYSLDYADNIKKLSIARQIGSLGRELVAKVNENVEVDKILADLETTLRSLTHTATPAKNISVHQYFNFCFLNEVKASMKYSTRKTGFYNIDANQIFAPGLYVVGATPAAGKTTFCWQLLEQLADKGEHCIFVSYEMSALELCSKTFERRRYTKTGNDSLSAAKLRTGGDWTNATEEDLARRDAIINDKTNQLLSSQFENLSLIDDPATNDANVYADVLLDDKLANLEVLPLRAENVDEMLRLIRPYCDANKSPVVCIDYLQIIPPSNDVKNATDKAKIDDIVHKLKTFQRETNTTFIVISSFNRMNYYQQASFESFKESGGIEYSADVIWAFQLYCVNDVKAGAEISKVREKFEEAKKKQPRQIQMKCLKNRSGSNYDCYFEYFAKHDYFKPVEESAFESFTSGNDDESDDNSD